MASRTIFEVNCSHVLGKLFTARTMIFSNYSDSVDLGLIVEIHVHLLCDDNLYILINLAFVSYLWTPLCMLE